MVSNFQFINLERIYQTASDKIFNLFQNGTVFRLTGADEIQFDFKPTGQFSLTFKERGKIYGHFVQIERDEIIIEWNVNGFGLPDETGTLLEIHLRNEGGNCKLVLCHKYILSRDSSIAKERAWCEILENIYLQL